MEKHGDYKTRLYNIFKCMKRRCNNKNYKRYIFYGGKGVKICKEWNTYLNFKKWSLENGYQDNLSIGRINNDGNYEPSNCRWETLKQQANNTSRSHFIKYKNMKLTISQWADYLNLTYNQVNCSLFRGYTIKEIIEHKPKFKIKGEKICL